MATEETKGQERDAQCQDSRPKRGEGVEPLRDGGLGDGIGGSGEVKAEPPGAGEGPDRDGEAELSHVVPC